MKTSIGIDLGGTWMRAALVREDGELLQVLREPTRPERGAQDVLERMAALAKSLPGFETACCAGVGVPASVDPKTGTLLLSSNLVGFESLAAAPVLSQLLGLPVCVENDANVACAAEALLGAGKDMDTVVYVTISTGIGGGVWARGGLLTGMHGCAGEFGCVCIDPRRSARLDLGPGAVESDASGTAITRRAAERFGRPFAHAGELFDLAAAGDPDANALVDDVALDIAQLFSALACILDPGAFVLGGGVMKSADVLLPRLEKAYAQLIPAAFSSIPMRAAVLSEPGLIGAGLLALHELA